MAGDLRDAIGRNLRQIRQAQGLTQERFAYRYGLQRAWVGHVETFKLNLTIDTVQRLADSLQVEVFVLVRRPGEPPPPTELVSEQAG